MARRNFKQVAFDTEFDEGSVPLIKVFRRGGSVLAIKFSMEWFEPDGHEHTGFVDVFETGPMPAEEFFAEEIIPRANIALEDDALWDHSWGKLR